MTRARPSTIPALDAMRLIGVLAVLGTHAGFHAGIYTNSGVFGNLVSRLAVGVAIFFVLSGFLLSREWLVRTRSEQPAPGAGRYYWKRFWRIYPAYLVVAVVVLLALPANRDRSPGEWVSTLLLADPYTTHPLPDGFTQTWSLTTEVAFYLVLPLLMALVAGRNLKRFRVIAFLACSIGISIWWILGPTTWDVFAGRPSAEWLPAYLSWFAAGIGLAVLHTTPDLFPRVHAGVQRLAAAPGVCWTLALAAMLVSSTSVAGPWLPLPMTRPEELTRHILYLAVGVLVMLPAAFGPASSRWVQFLSHRTLRHLGHISYSIFLTHLAVIELVLWLFDWPRFGGHFLGIFFATLAGSIAISEVVYRFVERPATRFGHRRKQVAPATPIEPSVR